MVLNAPHLTRTSRVDEVTAARKPDRALEARSDGEQSGRLNRSDCCLILGLVLLIRLPFLNQADSGRRSLLHLPAPQHAQIDPAHPSHAQLRLPGRRWSTCEGIRIRR